MKYDIAINIIGGRSYHFPVVESDKEVRKLSAVVWSKYKNTVCFHHYLGEAEVVITSHDTGEIAHMKRYPFNVFDSPALFNGFEPMPMPMK